MQFATDGTLFLGILSVPPQTYHGYQFISFKTFPEFIKNTPAEDKESYPGNYTNTSV